MCSSLRTNNKAINLITYLLKVKKARVIHISRVYCSYLQWHVSSEPRLFIDPSLPKHNINCWGDHPTDCKQFLHLGASKCVIVWYQDSKSRMWWRFSCVKGHWAWLIVSEKRFCAIHPNFLNYCQRASLIYQPWETEMLQAENP